MSKKMPWLAALLNFFTLGLGTVYNGKRMLVGFLMFVGLVLAFYVENSLKAAAPQLYWYMFGAVFALAIGTAIDGYNEAKSTGI